MKRILFVCTGNTCRSPMAEQLFRNMAQEANLKVEVFSAGVATLGGDSIAENAKKILMEKGIEGDFASSMITSESIERADLILTMTMGHKSILLEMYPHAFEKTYTLKEFGKIDDDKAELRQQYVDLQLKQSLNQPLTEDEEKLWYQFQQDQLNLDIADPFGGDLSMYRHAAFEIEQQLIKIIDRWVKEKADD